MERTRPIRLGDTGLPTRAWAEDFTARYPDYLSAMLVAYRNRVRQYYLECQRLAPDAFFLFDPVRVRVIASLSFIWTFVQSARFDHQLSIDEITVEPHWEHPKLADWDFFQSPTKHAEGIVRRLFGLSLDTWELLDVRRVPDGLYISDTASFGLAADDGRTYADMHNTRAELGEIFTDTPIDTVALARARIDLETLGTFKGTPQERGRRLQTVFRSILAAHGCVLEPGRVTRGEQIDLFMIEPHSALIEVRWLKEPVGVTAIRDLESKLGRRPAAVSGVYASMSNFTEPAIELAASNARQRTVLLAGSDDIRAFASGELHFKEWWRREFRELITRYPGSPSKPRRKGRHARREWTCRGRHQLSACHSSLRQPNRDPPRNRRAAAG
jgi:restriction endonuclease